MDHILFAPNRAAFTNPEQADRAVNRYIGAIGPSELNWGYDTPTYPPERVIFKDKGPKNSGVLVDAGNGHFYIKTLLSQDDHSTFVKWYRSAGDATQSLINLCWGE